jgi:hypothetical protein
LELREKMIMKTVNLTEEEHAELLKLRAAKTTKASATSHQDVVRAAGTSEGVAKSWQKRRTEAWDATGFAGEMSSKAHSGTASHLDAAGAHEKAAAIHNEIASLHEPGSRKFELHDSNARAHEKAAEQHQYEDVQSKPAKASDATNTEVIHCRAHASAAGSVLAADAAWSPGESVEFMWMPAGRHTICAGFRNGSIELTVNCDENTAANVQASLDAWRAERPKQEPFGCIEHREHEASVRVSAQQAFSFKNDGVYIAAEPTVLGAQNVNGKVHRSWSPSFTTDADYSQAKTVKTASGATVMVFPEGARGSRSNPAQITGVDFCVGTLTNKPAFHSMSPVKASDAVTAAGTSEGVRKAWESRRNEMKDAASHHRGLESDHEESNPQKSAAHGRIADLFERAHEHMSSGSEERAEDLFDRAQGLEERHIEPHHYFTAKASDASSTESITAHCANTLKQDVPDATPAEIACYEKCVDEGGSHATAVAEVKAKRRPEYYAQASEELTPEAIYASLEARQQAANGVATEAGVISIDDVYNKVTASGASEAVKAASGAFAAGHPFYGNKYSKLTQRASFQAYAHGDSSHHAKAADAHHAAMSDHIKESVKYSAGSEERHAHLEAASHHLKESSRHAELSSKAEGSAKASDSTSSDPIHATWSDAARKAAAEARKKHSGETLASKLSSIAHSASGNAKTRGDHNLASSLHDQAAEAHDDIGSSDAEEHRELSEHHAAMAEESKAKASESKLTLQSIYARAGETR